MFEGSTKIDVSVQKQLNKKLFIVSLILIIIGGIGSVTYIVLSVLDIIWSTYLLVFCLPLGVGIGYLYLIRKNIKTVSSQTHENFYTFEQDYFNVKTLRNGEEIGNSKIYYKDLVKVKEIGKYIFLYINQASAMPIDKTTLKDDDLILLKAFLKINK